MNQNKNRTNFDGLSEAKALPNLPGVYRMLGPNDDVLYVGKAVSLKKRVVSYFRKAEALSPRIQLMVRQVVRLESTVTRSESEALVLENNLIKSLKPKYNILFRDDKSYPYIILTKHAYPKMSSYRGSRTTKDLFFGPFTNTYAVRESIHLLQKVFRLRTCENTVFSNRSRPCLLYQIQRCSGPCVNRITKEDYQSDVKNVSLFLQGKENEVIQSLERDMLESSESMKFERAAIYRDRIRALTKVRETQFVTGAGNRNVDIVTAASIEGLVGINLTVVRGGSHRGDKMFYPKNASHRDEVDALEAFLTHYYQGGAVPDEIVINKKVDKNVFIKFFEQSFGKKVRINDNPIAERRMWLKMSEKNVEVSLQRQLLLKETQVDRLVALQSALALEVLVQRIECFDISHTMGEATVASCVVYDRGEMQHGEYRRFNISGITPGDDYAAMRQVVSRRYQGVISGEGKLPDLVLIDGGKGQLSSSMDALSELNLDDLSVIGVAKGEERKAGKETLINARTGEVIQLNSNDPGLHLIQQIRDESHRFAIQGHRKKRDKKRTQSRLEDIEGIGAKRRQRLLSQFGGVKEVSAASVEEISKVDGISMKLAEHIYRQLH
ncbi:excinuclease ABC subunit UvrC [Burkholderiales bacterium]|jgi:excinuclease ABC subunit C|nr:excinuclease ABC subunit UvrC [Betaproteobacteria bacterium]MDC3409190.1 excinuclease ABC subunit UvrC [Burkholderiales bacterium]